MALHPVNRAATHPTKIVANGEKVTFSASRFNQFTPIILP